MAQSSMEAESNPSNAEQASAKQATAGQRKANIPIVRRPKLKYENAKIPRFYYQNSPALTNLWNVFHALATPIESFFIQDGRAILPTIKDPLLQQQVENFVRQEASHSAEHHQVNKMLSDWGYPIHWAQQEMHKVLKKVDGPDQAQLRMAITVAGEHFLGELGYIWVVDKKLMAGFDPTMKKLFQWHGYEELEHHHVSVDCYYHLYGKNLSSYLVRLKGIWIASFVIGPVILKVHRRFNRVDGVGGLKDILELLKFQFVSPAFALRLARKVLPILSPRFHPNKFRNVAEELERFNHLVEKDWEVSN